MRRLAPMTKLLWLTLILFSLAVVAPSQRRTSRVNRPPVINSFKSSLAEICLPCPPYMGAGKCVTRGYISTLLVDATDPDGDTLSYKYTATGGEISGTGRTAVWNFKGATPGTYKATATVRDKRRGMVAKSLSLEVVPACSDLPCNTLIIECPDDVEEGQQVIFTARISGGDPTVKPAFNWIISTGKIIKGRGTNIIVVDTRGLAGEALKASLEIIGYPPECANTASCETRVKTKTQ